MAMTDSSSDSSSSTEMNEAPVPLRDPSTVLARFPYQLPHHNNAKLTGEDRRHVLPPYG